MGLKISFDCQKLLKNFATVHSECTTKYEKGETALFPIRLFFFVVVVFLAIVKKKSKSRLKKEIFILMNNIVLTEN